MTGENNASLVSKIVFVKAITLISLLYYFHFFHQERGIFILCYTLS